MRPTFYPAGDGRSREAPGALKRRANSAGLTGGRPQPREILQPRREPKPTISHIIDRSMGDSNPIRGASPLGLPDTRSRAPRRRRAPLAWHARGTRSLGICEMASAVQRTRSVSPDGFTPASLVLAPDLDRMNSARMGVRVPLPKHEDVQENRRGACDATNTHVASAIAGKGLRSLRSAGWSPLAP